MRNLKLRDKTDVELLALLHTTNIDLQYRASLGCDTQYLTLEMEVIQAELDVRFYADFLTC